MDISPLASVLAIPNCTLGIDEFFVRYSDSRTKPFIPRIIRNQSLSRITHIGMLATLETLLADYQLTSQNREFEDMIFDLFCTSQIFSFTDDQFAGKYMAPIIDQIVSEVQTPTRVAEPENQSPQRRQDSKPRTPIVVLPSLFDDSVFGGVILITLLVEKTRPEPKPVNDKPLTEIKQPVVQSLATSASVIQPQQRVRRGRKPKYSPESDQRIQALWVSGQFATQDILATHLNTSLSEVKKALDRERHRRRTVVNTE